MASILNEHYRYLSLTGRTEAYRKAIHEAVREGDVVADLGSGFGILGMLALEAGAAKCHAIDETAAIEIARETMRRQGLEERFNAVRGSTFKTNLPEQVDLLICDHIGYFGFDYGIIAMLADARKRMLKPGGQIMPQSMDFHITLVESATMRGKVDRWNEPAIPEAYQWLGELEANTQRSQRFAAEEVLSDPVQIGSVDFQSEAPDLFTFTGKLTARRSGEVDGIGGFFSAQLSDSVAITNSPLAPDAIGRANAYLPCKEQFSVTAGDSVRVSLSIRHDPRIINWSITPPGDAPKQSMSTWKGQILSRDELPRTK